MRGRNGEGETGRKWEDEKMGAEMMRLGDATLGLSAEGRLCISTGQRPVYRNPGNVNATSEPFAVACC